MSYSFSILGASKADAKAKVAAEFDRVAANQSCHEVDKLQALAAAGAFIDILPDDEGKNVSVSMNGYLSGQWQGNDIVRINVASVSISAGLIDKVG